MGIYIKKKHGFNELKVLRECYYLKLRVIRILENTIDMSLEEYERLGVLRYEFSVIEAQIKKIVNKALKEYL